MRLEQFLKITAGSQWEDRDWRESGRILEVVESPPPVHPSNPTVQLRTIKGKIGAREFTTMRAENLIRRFRPMDPQP